MLGGWNENDNACLRETVLVTSLLRSKNIPNLGILELHTSSFLECCEVTVRSLVYPWRSVCSERTLNLPNTKSCNSDLQMQPKSQHRVLHTVGAQEIPSELVLVWFCRQRQGIFLLLGTDLFYYFT
jgi:hypothetical protein